MFVSTILYRSDGTELFVEPENGTDFSLQELYRLLETDRIETIPLDSGGIMVIDEEGKFRDPLIDNVTATKIATLFAGDFIAGHALVCRNDQLK